MRTNATYISNPFERTSLQYSPRVVCDTVTISHNAPEGRLMIIVNLTTARPTKPIGAVWIQVVFRILKALLPVRDEFHFLYTRERLFLSEVLHEQQQRRRIPA